MRIWAENCVETAAAVRQADKDIVGFIEEKLVDIGLSKKDARVFSKLSHSCSVGLFAVGYVSGRASHTQGFAVFVPLAHRAASQHPLPFARLSPNAMLNLQHL